MFSAASTARPGHPPDRAARTGAAASMRCSARRSRAAATISIARVIFWMFLTDAMRFLMSFWVAMG